MSLQWITWLDLEQQLWSQIMQTCVSRNPWIFSDGTEPEAHTTWLKLLRFHPLHNYKKEIFNISFVEVKLKKRFISSPTNFEDFKSHHKRKLLHYEQQVTWPSGLNSKFQYYNEKNQIRSSTAEKSPTSERTENAWFSSYMLNLIKTLKEHWLNLICSYIFLLTSY